MKFVFPIIWAMHLLWYYIENILGVQYAKDVYSPAIISLICEWIFCRDFSCSSLMSDAISLAVFHSSCAAMGAGIMSSVAISAHCQGSMHNAIIEYIITNMGHTKRFIKNLTEFLNAGSLSFVKIYLQIRATGLASSDAGIV